MCHTAAHLVTSRILHTQWRLTPDLNPVIWGQCGVCLPLPMFVYVLKHLLSIDMTLWTGHWRHIKEGATEAGVFLFHLCLCSSHRLGHLSHGQASRVLRPGEEKRRRRNKVVQEELGRQGHLSNYSRQVAQHGLYCECDRYQADVEDRYIHKHEHTHSLSRNYLYSLITITHLFTCPLMPARKMSCISIVPLGRVCH